MTSEILTEALNHLQRAYNEWMRPGWDAEKNGASHVEAGKQIATRGVAITVAFVAMGMYYVPAKPSDVREAMGEIAASLYRGMCAEQAKDAEDLKS